MEHCQATARWHWPRSLASIGTDIDRLCRCHRLVQQRSLLVLLLRSAQRFQQRLQLDQSCCSRRIACLCICLERSDSTNDAQPQTSKQTSHCNGVGGIHSLLERAQYLHTLTTYRVHGATEPTELVATSTSHVILLQPNNQTNQKPTPPSIRGTPRWHSHMSEFDKHIHYTTKAITVRHRSVACHQ
jgi:hypothetical protein